MSSRQQAEATDARDSTGGVVESLSRRDAYPRRPAQVEVRETHLSWVFLAGDSAYKLKKPLLLPFVDYGTRERRRLMCLAEVRLNRRLAPSVYRGIRAVVPAAGGGFRIDRADNPDAVEHVVEMRRFDERRTLASLVAAGTVGPADIEAVAARLAKFHAAVPPVLPARDPLTPLRAAADETRDTLFELGAPRDRLVAAQRFSSAFLVARGETLRARARAGCLRDGHGDLRADHVLLEDGVEVVDCVEFDPGLRRVDVGADLAFLTMDLEHRGAPELARTLERSYRAHGGDPGDDALLAFHAAQRAWVRAKVALLRARQLELGSARAAAAERQAGDLLALGRLLCWRARRPLLLVICGLSATGKTAIARELARASGTEVLSSDVIRKQLAGLAPHERACAEHYSEEFSRRTYRELGRRAAGAMKEEGAAIVDATFRDAADRHAFLSGLGRASGEPRFVECIAPPALVAERARSRAERGGDASDADLAVVRAQRFEPLSEVARLRHLMVRTDRSVALAAGDVEAWLDARLASGGEPRT